PGPGFPPARGGRETPIRPPNTRGMTKRFLTPQEVAELLRVSAAAIHRLLRRGELPSVRVGRAWRVDEAELQRWLRRHSSIVRGRDGRGELCLCGCGEQTITRGARFRPGHDGKLIHRLMTNDGLTFDAARKAVRQIQRPRVQGRLF
ncbi:MAG TPA: helix-turn-helix domain-containing protein, partial [bacterium]|nr:helix-turn-helix domain-containing protein [bacterium]